MTRQRSLAFMIWLTLSVVLFGITVGNWMYQDAVENEELNQEIRAAAQRGYKP